MGTRGWRSFGVLFCIALVVLVFNIRAATTVMQVQLGQTFTGDITAGADLVQARVNLVEGSAIRVTAAAMGGSTLQPTVTIRNGAGAVVSQGTTLSIEWLPVTNVLHFFTPPASGMYTVEIGGAAGSGPFSAAITGQLPSGVALRTLSGTVTNQLTGQPLAGVTVMIGNFVLVTGANGVYSGTVPADDYDVMLQTPGYISFAGAVSVTTGGPSTFDVSLLPTVPVQVTANVTGVAAPGGSLTGALVVEAQDGSTIQSISWTQEHGAPATIVGGDTATPTVTLPDLAAFRDHLMELLAEPPVGQEQLPPNVQLPPGEFPGGLQDRFQVVGINPFMIEEAAVVTLHVEVTTSSGTYTDEVEIHAPLPWKPTAGIRNVPVGVPVLLHGKDQGSYDWGLDAPVSSTATLAGPTTQNPEFTPDLPGMYEVTVTEETTRAPVTLQIHAGTWRGAIAGQDAEGRPVADNRCLICHNNVLAEDTFEQWAQTGHAEIFTNNLNTSTHYGSNCFSCHMVGYDTDAANGGADDAEDYGEFLGLGLLNNPGDNWSTALIRTPEMAQLANIQCENCHGPQSADVDEDNPAHGWNGPIGEPRVSLSGDVCATCHGEPLRHARFQQWQLSAHANYELAIEEGGSGNCSRCHTGNGFLEWLPILLDDDPETDPLDSIDVAWTTDETHPQTCATCHDPHNIGTTTGVGTNATVRISGDTPPLIAGFTATDVGRGAICMTCHNSRRGLRNDEVFDEFFGTAEAARAAHGSAQTDVLMGQNAYLVSVGTRGSHSFLEDTCVKCHMEETPPPAVLSYNQGGTNHTFFASPTICANCHEDSDLGSAVQDTVEGFLDDVQALVEAGIEELILEMTAAGNVVDLNGAAQITAATPIEGLVFGEARGRQAITVTLQGGTVVGPYRLNDVEVMDPAARVTGDLYDFADPALIKAGWNWTLFHNDGSLGAHNPAFAFQALVASRNALLDAPVDALRPSEMRDIWRRSRARDLPPRPVRSDRGTR